MEDPKTRKFEIKKNKKTDPCATWDVVTNCVGVASECNEITTCVVSPTGVPECGPESPLALGTSCTDSDPTTFPDSCNSIGECVGTGIKLVLRLELKHF